MPAISYWMLTILVWAILAQFVCADLTIADVSVKVAAKDGTSKTESPKYPSSFSATLNLADTDTLTVSFKATTEDGNPKSLHHAFVILTRKAKSSEEAENFAVTILAEEKERGRYIAELDLSSSSNRDLFHGVPGAYALSIATAPTLPSKKTYELGSVDVSIPSDPLWGLTSKVSGIEEVFASREEIQHIFGAPPRIAPRFVSDFFTLVVLAPWVLLIGAWSSLGANVSNIFSSSSSMLYGSSFVAILSGWVVVMVLYWTTWNVFQLLFYGGLYALATGIVGRQALIVRASARENGSN
ncbi:Dolichyl-diphosphooligosaccharide--protein glycosyltransferase subunit Swp1 [Cladochytrium replicatum]|nr:Dolichyl-diphosphooligosaccharide--protein glycosyltransferase subunit Swp1 [Cladochytrium replicatum]